MPSFIRKFSSKTTPTITTPPATTQPQSFNGAVAGRAPQTPAAAPPVKTTQRREDAWTRNELLPEDVQDLLHICTQELKSRALDTPFFLLPFRPNSTQYLSTVRAFIRRYFKDETSQNSPLSSWSQEMKLLEPMVLCSILRWCWSRLKGGVITWNTYELFNTGEKQSNMDKQAFDTFLPLSTGSRAHQLIILDFFDLLAAIAAHSRSNGFGGLKLSRFMGWFAFTHTANKGFDSGYKSWTSAANATSHMFFAYLRARAPLQGPGSDSISLLPRAMVALINETIYPPPKPKLLESVAPSVLMIVDAVSPTPIAMLERAKNLNYRDSDHVLTAFAQYQDPAKALTAECGRVFEMIATNIQSSKFDPTASPSADASWTRFEDMGFSGLTRKTDGNTTNGLRSRSTSTNEVSSPSRRISSRQNQSWADFMSTGFADEDGSSPPPLSLPAKQYMPALGNDNDIVPSDSRSFLPGELAGTERFGLDETFWWVWMESLAPEETPDRKAVFGRCVLAELDLTGSRWLVIEEQIRPAVQTIQEDVVSPSATSPERKRPFFATKKSRTMSSQRQMSSNSMQRVSSSQKIPTLGFDNDHHDTGYSSAQSTPAMGADQQHALIQAAAAQLVQKVNTDDSGSTVAQRRGRKDADSDSKTVSVLSMQPVFVKDAGPALQWARKFDKEITRSRFDDQASEMGSVSDAVLPGRSLLPAYSSKEDISVKQSQASAGVPENSSIAAVEAIMRSSQNPAQNPMQNMTQSTTQNAVQKEEMVPSPLRIPKRKPVATSPSPLSPNQATMDQADIDSSSADCRQTQDTTVTNGSTISADLDRPALQKSNIGSRRGLRDLFKRKVTDPTTKSSAQRAVSGPSQRAVSSSTIVEGAETSQQEPRTVTRKRSLLKKKLEKAAASSNALTKEHVATPVDDDSSGASRSQPERKKFGPEAPTKAHEGMATTSEQPLDLSPAPVQVEDSPAMTSKSAVFGAAQPDMLEDAANYAEPPSPAFSNFTSAANMDHDRTTTMSTVPEIHHARSETLQSMPAYALGFDPGSPQRAHNASVPQHNGSASYQTRAAASLVSQGKPANAQFPPRESSTTAQEPITTSIASPAATVYQTPLESSGAFPQNPLGSHPPEQSMTSSTSAGAQEEEADFEDDGAPRPNTQERLASASSRWAAIRQVAHERRISQEQGSTTPPAALQTPPWQQQAPVSNGYAGANEASGFSPGPANGSAKGLGIAGVAGIEREQQPKVEEESIDDRVARIKARVAQLTGGMPN